MCIDNTCKTFVKEISALVDEHANNDQEAMDKLESLAFDILSMLDGLYIENLPLPITLCVKIEGEFKPVNEVNHHLFVKERLFKNPKRRKELSGKFRAFLAARRGNARQ